MVEFQIDKSFRWKEIFTKMQGPLSILKALDIVCTNRKDKIMHEIEKVLEKEIMLECSEKQQVDLQNAGYVFFLQLTNQVYNLEHTTNIKTKEFLGKDCKCCRCNILENKCLRGYDMDGFNENCICLKSDIIEKSKEIEAWYSESPRKQYSFLKRNRLDGAERMSIWLQHILKTIEKDNRENVDNKPVNSLLGTLIKIQILKRQAATKKQLEQYYDDLANTNYGRVHRAEYLEIDIFDIKNIKNKVECVIQEYIASSIPKPLSELENESLGYRDEDDTSSMLAEFNIILDMEECGYNLSYFKVAKLYEQLLDFKKAFEYHELSAWKFKNKESAMYCVNTLLQFKKGQGPTHGKYIKALNLLESLVVEKKYPLDEPTVRLLELYSEIEENNDYYCNCIGHPRKEMIQENLKSMHFQLAQLDHVPSIHYMIKTCDKKIQTEKLGFGSYEWVLKRKYAYFGCELEDHESMYHYAVCILEEGDPSLESAAMKYLEKAANNGHELANEKYYEELLTAYETLSTSREKTELLRQVCAGIQKSSRWRHWWMSVTPKKKYSIDHYKMLTRMFEYQNNWDRYLASRTHHDYLYAHHALSLAYEFAIDYRNGSNRAKRNRELSIYWFEHYVQNQSKFRFFSHKKYTLAIQELIQYYDHKDPKQLWKWSRLLFEHVSKMEQ